MSGPDSVPDTPIPEAPTSWLRRLYAQPGMEWVLVALYLTLVTKVAGPWFVGFVALLEQYATPLKEDYGPVFSSVLSSVRSTLYPITTSAGLWPDILRIASGTPVYLWVTRSFCVLLGWLWRWRRQGLSTWDPALLGRVFGAPVRAWSDRLGGPRLTRVLAYPVLMFLVASVLSSAVLKGYARLFG